jgi:hypothetical protein
MARASCSGAGGWPITRSNPRAAGSRTCDAREICNASESDSSPGYHYGVRRICRRAVSVQVRNSSSEVGTRRALRAKARPAAASACCYQSLTSRDARDLTGCSWSQFESGDQPRAAPTIPTMSTELMASTRPRTRHESIAQAREISRFEVPRALRPCNLRMHFDGEARKWARG